MYGFEYLRRKMNEKRSRVLKRYGFYEMSHFVEDLNISTPPNLRYFFSSLGWCEKAVDSIADRLAFDGLENDNFNMGELFALNNQDIWIDSAILGALIGSCSFIYLHKDGANTKIEVIDGANATGIIDANTFLLKEGYAVLERDATNGTPTIEAYFEPYKTTFFYTNGETRIVKTNVEYPLLVPFIHRPDARRPFGHSRISRACMSIQEGAIRTIKRSEIGAEFFAFPQKYVTGLSQDAEVMDKWRASMSSLISFTKDEDGDHPTLGQFAQQSQTPHLEQLKMFASLFAGESGLTLDDLGFPNSNPSSAESIKASHETLRLMSRKAERQFGVALLNVGLVASCLRDDTTYKRDRLHDTIVNWLPTFEPDISALSGVGDAIMKLNQSYPDYFDEKKIHKLTGI